VRDSAHAENRGAGEEKTPGRGRGRGRQSVLAGAIKEGPERGS
jgi:hypothetical protein